MKSSFIKVLVATAAIALSDSVQAETWSDGTYTWTYRLVDDTVEIYKSATEAAIDPKPTGDLTIRSEVNDKPVTKLGSASFYNCDSLTSVTIPDGVTHIGAGAFEACDSLVSVHIPEDVTSIGIKAFKGCSSLTEVTIPSTVTEIADEMFLDCSGITDVTILGHLTGMGPNAFNNMSSLKKFHVTSGEKSNVEFLLTASGLSLTGITVVEDVELYDGIVWHYVISGGEATIYNDGNSAIPTDTEGYITIPDTLGGCPVTAIGMYAFQYCDSIWGVEIPEGVKSIEAYAFVGCTSIEDVDFPSTLESIGDSAFESCVNLLYAEIPEGVTSIGAAAFKSCSKLSDIVIPAGVTAIEALTFFGCDLEEVTIAGNLLDIGASAFYGATPTFHVVSGEKSTVENLLTESGLSLGDIEVLEDMEKVGDIVWHYYINDDGEAEIDNDGKAAISTSTAGKVTVPDMLGGCPVTAINDAAFEDCASITEIVIPESITSIEDGAFWGCSGLSDANGFVVVRGVLHYYDKPASATTSCVNIPTASTGATHRLPP